MFTDHEHFAAVIWIVLSRISLLMNIILGSESCINWLRGCLLQFVAHSVNFLDVGEDHLGIHSPLLHHSWHVFCRQEVGNSSKFLSSCECKLKVLFPICRRFCSERPEVECIWEEVVNKCTESSAICPGLGEILKNFKNVDFYLILNQDIYLYLPICGHHHTLLFCTDTRWGWPPSVVTGTSSWWYPAPGPGLRVWPYLHICCFYNWKG